MNDTELKIFGKVMTLIKEAELKIDEPEYKAEYMNDGAEQMRNLMLNTLTAHILKNACGYCEEQPKSEFEELPF